MATFREMQEAELRRRARLDDLVLAGILLVLVFVLGAGMVLVPGWLVESPVDAWAGEGSGAGRSSAGAPEPGGAGVSRAGGGR